MTRRFDCCGCGARVTIPWAWVMGVEMVFRCKQCRKPYKTGYKTGAFLSGLSLAVALALANGAVWLFSSVSIPVVVLGILPGWIAIAFPLRKWWMLRKAKKNR